MVAAPAIVDKFTPPLGAKAIDGHSANTTLSPATQSDTSQAPTTLSKLVKKLTIFLPHDIKVTQDEVLAEGILNFLIQLVDRKGRVGRPLMEVATGCFPN